MDCYGCAVMDPWRDKRDGVHLMFPPFAPSIALSMYAPMLREWLHYFNSTSIHVMNYEEAIKDPLETANTLLRFIGEFRCSASVEGTD
jgi:Sulfotransferase domain